MGLPNTNKKKCMNCTKLEERFAKAEECFRMALADNDVKSYRGLAWALLQEGKHKELEEFLAQRALKNFPKDSFLLQIHGQITK